MDNLFDISRLFTAIPQILPCLSITFQIVIVGVVFGSLLGLIIASLRINKIPVVDQFLSLYLSFMRGTPMLVQMMVIYYGLPLLIESLTGININIWDKLVFVEITFVINEGAFLGELFRGAIESVPYNQTEAGYSVGLNSFQTFTRIVLPQAVKTALPGYGIDIIGVFHNTQIAFLLGAVDILGRARTIGNATGHAVEAYLFVAILYIVISIILRVLFNRVDKKFSFGGEAKANAI